MKTLPQGPVECSEDWYALNRLAFSTCGLHLWSDSDDIWVSLFSRVLEKTPEYAVACFTKALEQVDLTKYDYIVFWQDGPSQFKCGMTMGSVVSNLGPLYNLKCISFEYGAPKHFKSVSDDHFGRISQQMALAKVSMPLIDISNVVEAMKKADQLQKEAHPNDPIQHYLEFLPEQKESYKLQRFTAASSKGIKGSYSISFKFNDTRRKTLRSRTDPLQLTGVTMRNHGMTGLAVDLEKTGYPCLTDPSKETPGMTQCIVLCWCMCGACVMFCVILALQFWFSTGFPAQALGTFREDFNRSEALQLLKSTASHLIHCITSHPPSGASAST